MINTECSGFSGTISPLSLTVPGPLEAIKAIGLFVPNCALNVLDSAFPSVRCLGFGVPPIEIETFLSQGLLVCLNLVLASTSCLLSRPSRID